MLTDQELQSLRNLGNEAEAAAEEIVMLRAELAAERERCARVCEDEARLWERDGNGMATEARICAARIRAMA